jgi:hypothetical protein
MSQRSADAPDEASIAEATSATAALVLRMSDGHEASKHGADDVGIDGPYA